MLNDLSLILKVPATLSQQGGGVGGSLSREVPGWLGAAPTSSTQNTCRKRVLERTSGGSRAVAAGAR